MAEDKPLIVIDAGHGAHDPGAMNGTLYEKNLNLQIALGVRDYLLANADVEVVMTRETDVFLELEDRSKVANDLKADFFISTHINSGDGTGYESFIHNIDADDSPDALIRNAFHDEFVKRVVQPYGMTDRGKKRADYVVLRTTNMPSLLSEVAFITNDVDKLSDPSFIDAAIVGTAEGIIKAIPFFPVKVPFVPGAIKRSSPNIIRNKAIIRSLSVRNSEGATETEH